MKRQVNREAFRQEIITLVKQHKLPAFSKMIQQKRLPVILLRKDTYPRLLPYLLNTFGLSASLGANNHGWLRLGKPSHALVDLFSPYERTPRGGYFESLHETGISWRPVELIFTEWRTKTSRVFFETAFALSSAELEVVEFYHRLRRMAAYISKYTFDDPGNAYVNKKPHILMTGDENCLTYGTAARGTEQITELKAVINELLGTPVDFGQLFSGSALKRLIARVKAKIMNADWKNPGAFSIAALSCVEYREQLGSIIPGITAHEIPAADSTRILCYLVSIHALDEYVTLMQQLNVYNYSYADPENAEVDLIFIWDERDEALQGFFPDHLGYINYEYRGSWKGCEIIHDIHNHIPF